MYQKRISWNKKKITLSDGLNTIRTEYKLVATTLKLCPIKLRAYFIFVEKADKSRTFKRAFYILQNVKNGFRYVCAFGGRRILGGMMLLAVCFCLRRFRRLADRWVGCRGQLGGRLRWLTYGRWLSSVRLGSAGVPLGKPLLGFAASRCRVSCCLSVRLRRRADRYLAKRSKRSETAEIIKRVNVLKSHENI